MQIEISKIAEDPRMLYKHPADTITISAEIKEDVQIMRPVFYIVYNSTIVDQHYNYVHAFGRYYFITDTAVTTGGSMRISCKMDVLYTYADQIVQCPIVAERSSNNFNAFIQDNERRFYQYTNNQYKVIGTDIGCPDIICMCTVG